MEYVPVDAVRLGSQRNRLQHLLADFATQSLIHSPAALPYTAPATTLSRTGSFWLLGVQNDDMNTRDLELATDVMTLERVNDRSGSHSAY